jgi:hypothetical protein
VHLSNTSCYYHFSQPQSAPASPLRYCRESSNPSSKRPPRLSRFTYTYEWSIVLLSYTTVSKIECLPLRYETAVSRKQQDKDTNQDLGNTLCYYHMLQSQKECFSPLICYICASTILSIHILYLGARSRTDTLPNRYEEAARLDPTIRAASTLEHRRIHTLE